jgi:hypothetical protein
MRSMRPMSPALRRKAIASSLTVPPREKTLVDELFEAVSWRLWTKEAGAASPGAVQPVDGGMVTVVEELVEDERGVEEVEPTAEVDVPDEVPVEAPVEFANNQVPIPELEREEKYEASSRRLTQYS